MDAVGDGRRRAILGSWIFDKGEGRSPGELVAQLFLQQCAPRLAQGMPPGIDGWLAGPDA